VLASDVKMKIENLPGVKKADVDVVFDPVGGRYSEPALRSAFATYSELAQGELAILESAAVLHRQRGPESIKQYVISKAESVSDLLEVAIELGSPEPGPYACHEAVQVTQDVLPPSVSCSRRPITPETRCQFSASASSCFLPALVMV